MKYILLLFLSIINLQISYSQSMSISVNGVRFTMVYVKGGNFFMGSDDWDSFKDERPVHKVTLSPFLIGQTEVTQDLWRSVMGMNPSKRENANNPVDCVSWNDCQVFIKKISLLTGYNFRLPTEAEWEFAARGGNYENKYSGSNVIGKVAFMGDNSASTAHSVAQREPNGYNLYDMTGNVWEWCSDWYAETYESNIEANDPIGPVNGIEHVIRGGSWNCMPRVCRVTNRYKCPPDGYRDDLGLRLVLDTNVIHK